MNFTSTLPKIFNDIVLKYTTKEIDIPYTNHE